MTISQLKDQMDAAGYRGMPVDHAKIPWHVVVDPDLKERAPLVFATQDLSKFIIFDRKASVAWMLTSSIMRWNVRACHVDPSPFIPFGGSLFPVVRLSAGIMGCGDEHSVAFKVITPLLQSLIASAPLRSTPAPGGVIIDWTGVLTEPVVAAMKEANRHNDLVIVRTNAGYRDVFADFADPHEYARVLRRCAEAVTDKRWTDTVANFVARISVLMPNRNLPAFSVLKGETSIRQFIRSIRDPQMHRFAADTLVEFDGLGSDDRHNLYTSFHEMLTGADESAHCWVGREDPLMKQVFNDGKVVIFPLESLPSNIATVMGMAVKMSFLGWSARRSSRIAALHFNLDYERTAFFACPHFDRISNNEDDAAAFSTAREANTINIIGLDSLPARRDAEEARFVDELGIKIFCKPNGVLISGKDYAAGTEFRYECANTVQ